MSDKETKKRIEKEAEESVSQKYDIDYPYEKYYVSGYIAGAISERPKVWNEAIDAAIEKVQIKVYNHSVNKDNVATLDECLAVLEQLKHKQP